jgi:DNA-binding transcriptional MerR regulator
LIHLNNGTTKITLPPIPAKRYFTIGEAGDLCGVKTHVLRYWEQEFQQLNPIKRRGNRRYYQPQDVMLIRHIRELLYEKGYTIEGARSKMATQSTTNNTLQEIQCDLQDIISMLES